MKILIRFTTIILMVVGALSSVSASADAGKGSVKTTLSEASSNQPADTLLAGPGLEEGFSPPPPARKCRWVDDPPMVRVEPGQVYVTATTVVSDCGCCGGSVIVGGSLYQAPANVYTQSSARKVCD